MEDIKKPTKENKKKPKISPYWIPVFILVAGMLIALVIFLNTDLAQQPIGDDDEVEEEISINPVTEDDHIRGDADAPVKLIEFSDFQCPFCAEFHETMKELLEERGDDVAWVYRHAPMLPDPAEEHLAGSTDQAIASECVAEIGGNDAFWEYTDGIFDIVNAGEQVTHEDLISIFEDAGHSGEDVSELETCIEEERHMDKVEEHRQDALSAGSQGTPYSIMLGPEGEMMPLQGTQPLEILMGTLDYIVVEHAHEHENDHGH